MSNDFCYGCKYLHSEEMGGGGAGGRWRCTKTGHSYVVVGLFGYMSEDIEGDKPRPINECYVKRNGTRPETYKHEPAKPFPNETRHVSTTCTIPASVRTRDPLEACNS